MSLPSSKQKGLQTMLEAAANNVVLAGYDTYSNFHYFEGDVINLGGTGSSAIDLVGSGYLPFFQNNPENTFLVVETKLIDDPNDFLDSNGDPLVLKTSGTNTDVPSDFGEFYGNGQIVIGNAVANSSENLIIITEKENAGTYTDPTNFKMAFILKYYQLP